MTSSEIEFYLEKHGPTLSGDLVQMMLIAKVSNDAARKRLQRLKPPITRLSGFFKDNQSLFYLQEQYKSDIYYEGLLKALQESAKHYYAIIKAIQFHHGYVHVSQIANYSFSPILNLKTHKNLSNVLSDLESLDLIKRNNDDYTVTHHLSHLINDNYRYYKGVELAKDTLLTQFYTWSRSIGLISYDSGTFSSEYSKFQWGFVAPSYCTGILKYKEDKDILPAFVLADVLIGNSVRTEDVLFFIQKVEAIKALRKGNFLPFLIVSGVSVEALKLLKQKGIIVAFVDKMFGPEYEELLKTLINTITNAGAVLKNNPEAYINLIKQLNKLVEGKTNNLRGDLFELAVGYFHSNNCQSIDIGKKIIHEGRQGEMDVYAVYQNQLRIAECKGVKYQIDVDYIDRWLGDRLPLFYNWTRSLPENNVKEVVFEFWATGGFTKEAYTLLSNRIEKVKKYKIEVYDEKEMIKKAETSNAKKFIEVLREYFLKDV